MGARVPLDPGLEVRLLGASANPTCCFELTLDSVKDCEF